MATLVSSLAGSGDQPKYSAVGPVVMATKYTQTITASATDVLQLFKVQNGCRVLDLKVVVDGTATNSYSVGTGDDTGLFMTTASAILTAIAAPTASTVSSPVRSINVAGGVCYSFSATDTIDMRWDAAGGKTGGIVYAWAMVTYDSQETI
jgi:hypothetical protein